MADALSIKRRKTADTDTSFDALRSEALKLLQQVSGKAWTDFNLHDPGITILEQLIFAITDLVYRAEFPLQDYLTNEQGVIDFDRQALYSPVEAFPCRPTTILDYRKVLLDGVSELDNVWLTPVDAAGDEAGYPGLYKIAAKLVHGLDEKSRLAALQKIRDIYNRKRNLCEDVAQVTVVDDLDYVLCADIEVSSARRPVDILAEIYFECAHRLAGSVSITDYSKLMDRVGSLDQLFSGPFTSHGFFLDSDLGDNQREFIVSTLFYVINSIEGVEHIEHLYLEKDGERFYDVVTCDQVNQAFCLQVPQAPEEIRVVLSTSGRALPVSIDEFRARYEEIVFKYRSSRSTPQMLSFVVDLPNGMSRPVGEYTTIQHQFPDAYGISHFGLPETAPTQDKARARQLKSYMVIFEQILTNHLANLENVDALFSLDKDRRHTYAFNLLDHRQIAGLDAIYPKKPFDVLKDIISQHDDYHGRKSRILDYMLALYGESFMQNSLRHFNYYYSREEVEDVIVNNKIDYLQSVVQLGRDRAAAPDYTAESWGKRAQSGLQLRAGMLLGFEQRAARALTMAIFKQGIRLTRHSVYEELKAGSHEFRFIDMEDMDEPGRDSFENVPARPLPAGISLDALRRQVGDAIPLKNNTLSDMLLRAGIHLERYRVGSLTADQDYQLVFITGDSQYWYLGTYADREAANRAANALRHFLIMLNRESEGLHVIEHILLRPAQESSIGSAGPLQHEDFFSYRFSVVFPAWTARCYDKRFRMLAEETVRLNAPAHLYPEFCWLEFHKMYEFELLYEKWLELKSAKEPDMAELDERAQRLVAFLLDCRSRNEHAD